LNWWPGWSFKLKVERAYAKLEKRELDDYICKKHKCNIVFKDNLD